MDLCDYLESSGADMRRPLVANQLGADGMSLAFSCNCILNFLYDGLEGQTTGPFTGPMTFGEIAFLLLNQTLVYLSVEPV